VCEPLLTVRDRNIREYMCFLLEIIYCKCFWLSGLLFKLVCVIVCLHFQLMFCIFILMLYFVWI
jgi:hypothetical protein